jgi:hypothetical protein
MTSMIDKTISLLNRCENKLQEQFEQFHLVCKDCGDHISYFHENTVSIRTDSFQASTPASINQIISKHWKTNETNGCKHDDHSQITCQSSDRIVIFSFSNPVDVNIEKTAEIWGKQFVYKSHIGHTINGGKIGSQTFFEYNKRIFFQDDKGVLECSRYGIHTNVKIISFYVSSSPMTRNNEENKTLMKYGIPAQDYFRKLSVSVINPEKV